jgi:endonuclease/exonuclease/phosphatase family metal-dependent hydrolase
VGVGFARSLRIVSWNVGQLYFPQALRALFGEGLLEPWLVPGVVEALRGLDADVIVFQEMRNAELLEEIRAGLGGAYAGVLVGTDSTRQVAILHRLGDGWRVASVDMSAEMDLVDPYTHVLVLEGVWEGDCVRVIAAHATSQSSERRARYFDCLLEWMDAQPPVDLEAVVGDFNIVDRFCDATDARTLRQLRAAMQDADLWAGRPTFLGIVRLDYFFYRGRMRSSSQTKWSTKLEVLKGRRRGFQDHDLICVNVFLTCKQSIPRVKDSARSRVWWGRGTGEVNA